jgi:hypothetical protein
MKSISIRDFAQVNMKGKRTIRLACGCCEAQNFKWRERVREAKKEIKEIKNER